MKIAVGKCRTDGLILNPKPKIYISEGNFDIYIYTY